MSLPAAFWDALPAETNNPDLLAINALKEEKSSPEEKADNLKIQGNEFFTRGIQLKKHFFLQQAILKYTEGLTIPGLSEKRLKSILLSNRAQAHLRLANNRNAFNDALEALTIDPANDKAAFRGATAALRLKEFDKAEQMCATQIASKQPIEWIKLLEEVAKKREIEESFKQQEAMRQNKLRQPARDLARVLIQRGWRIAPPQLAVGARKPWVDAAGKVHWPMLFMYPEVMQNDVIEDFCELDLFQDHVDAMFGPEAPPLAWDLSGSYTRDKIELYYLSNAADALPEAQVAEALHGCWPKGISNNGPQQYGSNAARAVRLKEDTSLCGLLDKNDYVVPGIPIVFVLAAGSAFRNTFLESLS